MRDRQPNARDSSAREAPRPVEHRLQFCARHTRGAQSRERIADGAARRRCAAFGLRAHAADGVLVLGQPGKIVRELKQEDREYLLKVASGYVERSKLYKTQLKEQGVLKIGSDNDFPPFEA